MWMEAVLLDRDLQRAWLLTHPTFRRTFAQAWVTANANHIALSGRDHAELIASLSALQPADDLWPGFEETTLREFDEKWAHVDLDTWGWANHPRVVSPDREVVYLVDTQSSSVTLQGNRYVVRGDHDENVPVRAEGLVVEHLKSGETEGVQLLAGDTENLWRVVDLHRLSV
jgi:hypothetical protein